MDIPNVTETETFSKGKEGWRRGTKYVVKYHKRVEDGN